MRATLRADGLKTPFSSRQDVSTLTAMLCDLDKRTADPVVNLAEADTITIVYRRPMGGGRVRSVVRRANRSLLIFGRLLYEFKGHGSITAIALFRMGGANTDVYQEAGAYFQWEFPRLDKGHDVDRYVITAVRGGYSRFEGGGTGYDTGVPVYESWLHKTGVTITGVNKGSSAGRLWKRY